MNTKKEHKEKIKQWLEYIIEKITPDGSDMSATIAQICNQLCEVFYKTKTLLKLADCCAKSPDFVPVPINNQHKSLNNWIKVGTA
ncbi:MAG: hypothetical protein PHC28_16725 [Flavobacterium sp.]|uniref:hypothetical protein n=1 Tax=Flavobacterium sp. TaxID=239 RepID=UPI00262A7852|nr:hypothetical protein [Flavobacterium sp.]MDD5152097.1 hypothetical protein [Flavobacterium sp.]